jgi:hypothetical protein
MKEFSFRLSHNRHSKRRSILGPDFRTIVNVPEQLILEGVIEVTGVKESNGGIQITIKPYVEDLQKAKFNKHYKPRPFKNSDGD